MSPLLANGRNNLGSEFAGGAEFGLPGIFAHRSSAESSPDLCSFYVGLVRRKGRPVPQQEVIRISCRACLLPSPATRGAIEAKYENGVERAERRGRNERHA